MRVIDAHVHITENGQWFNTNIDASVDRLLSEMKKEKIHKAIILPIAPYISNEFVYNICKEYPDKFIGFASINPLEKNAPEKLEKIISKYNLKGLKLHPRLQGFRPNDKKIFKLYKKVEELGIPIIFDTIMSKRFPIKYQEPMLYDDVAKLIPETPIILAHFGGFKFFDAFIIAAINENIYFDTSVTLIYFHKTVFQDHIKFIFEKIGYDRIIYGSDFPEIHLGESLRKTKEILIEYGIKESEQRKIFGYNIKKLLR